MAVRLQKQQARETGVLVFAAELGGKRLASPNNLVYKSGGALYFSGPAAGLRNGYDDPKKELPYTGLFLLKDGKLRLLAKDSH